MRSLRKAINEKCIDCIYSNDEEVLGRPREQVSVCSCIECPLWPVRPLTKGAPEWLTSRDPADLPVDWVRMPHNDAIRVLWAAKRSQEGSESSLDDDPEPED